MPEPTSNAFLKHAISNSTQYTPGWQQVCRELLEARARITELERQLAIAEMRIADPSVCKHGSIGCIECERRCEACGVDGEMLVVDGERLCEDCVYVLNEDAAVVDGIDW